MHLWTVLIMTAILASAMSATATEATDDVASTTTATPAADTGAEPAPAPDETPAPAMPAGPAPIEVGRPDGSRQCEPDSGVPIDAMIATLHDAGVTVHGSRSAHDGLNRIAVCGAPTGRFHLFLIDPADLATAEGLGFRPVPPMP